MHIFSNPYGIQTPVFKNSRRILKESVQAESFYQPREQNSFDDEDSEDKDKDEEQNLIEKAKSGFRTSMRHMNTMNAELKAQMGDMVGR
jgi:hypothetical protein